MLQDDLVKQYKYKKLPDELSAEVRKQYLDNLQPEFKIDGDEDMMLCNKNGKIFALGYKRVVIGDYGAFIEFGIDQLVHGVISVKKGQEYRINDERYSNNVKYHWYTIEDGSDIKIYYQQKTVVYADYNENMFYVSPDEVILKEI